MDIKAYHDFLSHYQDHLFNYICLLDLEAQGAYLEAYDYLIELTLTSEDINEALALVSTGVTLPLTASDYYTRRSHASSIMYQLQREAHQYSAQVKSELLNEYASLSTIELFKNLARLEDQLPQILKLSNDESSPSHKTTHKLIALELSILDEVIMGRINIRTDDFSVVDNFATYLKNRIHRIQAEYDNCEAGYLITNSDIDSSPIVANNSALTLKSTALNLYFGIYTDKVRFFRVDTIEDYQNELLNIIYEYQCSLIETMNKLHEVLATVNIELSARKIISSFDDLSKNKFINDSNTHHKILTAAREGMRQAENFEKADLAIEQFPKKSLIIYSNLIKMRLENNESYSMKNYQHFKNSASMQLERMERQIQIEDRILALLPIDEEPPTKKARHR